MDSLQTIGDETTERCFLRAQWTGFLQDIKGAKENFCVARTLFNRLDGFGPGEATVPAELETQNKPMPNWAGGGERERVAQMGLEGPVVKPHIFEPETSPARDGGGSSG